MKENLKLIFQVATVFIGTIVGAGLASGKEITQFFTQYGIISFIGIIGCGIFYIIMGSIISKISIHHRLNSYSDVINLISPNLIGKFIKASDTAGEFGGNNNITLSSDNLPTH